MGPGADVTASLAQSPFVVRAPEGRAIRDAQAIVAEARAAAAAIMAGAEAARAAIEAEARTDGLAAAARQTAPLAASVATAIAAFWAGHEAEMREVVLAVAHRVLSRLPAEDLLIRLAREAIAEHAGDVTLALRVSSELVGPLRAALDAEPCGDRVVVVGDSDLSPGSCALFHARGRAELGLLAQFRAMMSPRELPATVRA